MLSDSNGYQKDFTDDGFWEKLRGFALSAGSEVVEKALWLYFAMERSETPVWARSTIVGALGYFISPIDAIPDIVPVVGYADDLGVLALAVATVAGYINEAVKQRASEKMADWFGESPKFRRGPLI